MFVAYAGIKGAYNSTVFSTLVVERNLIYLCPILFIATALAFTRGVGRGWAIAGAAVFTLYVVTAVPLRLDQYPYYEAHGLSIAAFANRELGWSEGTIEGVLVAACVVGLAVAVALKLLRPHSVAFAWVAGVAAVAVVAWSMTGQVYAAEGERRLRGADRPQPASSLRLGRGGDERGLGGRPRPADLGCDGHLADRVLQSVRAQDLEPRRIRAERWVGRY